jgi:predicted RNA-binding protein YlxR (DUF448 family)
MGKGKGHIPMRTCISCGTKRRKKELIRLRLSGQGLLIRDDVGEGHGRGAYVCSSKACWESLVKGRRVNGNFKGAELFTQN